MNYKEEMYLAHYGVPGMKWGVRKARRVDRKIQKTSAKVAANTAKKEKALAKNEKRYGGNAGKLAKKNAKVKAKYDFEATNLAYKAAKAKAKKDPAYKQSKDYQKVKTKAGDQLTKQILLGKRGATKFSELKTRGDSSTTAAAKIIATSVLTYGAIQMVGYQVEKQFKG